LIVIFKRILVFFQAHNQFLSSFQQSTLEISAFSTAPKCQPKVKATRDKLQVKATKDKLQVRATKDKLQVKATKDKITAKANLMTLLPSMIAFG
jgi:uncharacterized protein (DUF2345 family)